ncbi:MAG: PSD1 and planctomycete cytochrome C domain-containing protein [Bryobacteraceae bacterium]
MHRKFILGLIFPFILAAEEDLPRQAMEILATNCSGCHGEALRMSKLDLRTREAIITGGEHGAALVPGESMKSRIYRYAAHLEQPAMPPGKKLPDWQLSVLRRWIDTGAPMPAGGAVAQPSATEAMKAMEERVITDQERSFWSFRTVVRPDLPHVKNPSWARNPVDAFLLAKLESKDLEPAPPANRRTLIRRAHLDLTGIPPSPAEVEVFLADKSPSAYEKLVDRLLASPQYGERWARHWLDLVRYADSGGYEYDRDRAQIWRYRDYVIRSLNSDKPYDRFVREQIAGDEMQPPSQDGLIATAFLRLGPENNIKTEITRMDELDDIIATTSNAFLGMTLGCARCHNHKFDPIPQKDYYRIQAVFFSTKPLDYPLVSDTEVKRHKEAMKRVDGLIAPLKKQREDLDKPYRERLKAEKRAKLPAYVKLALATPPEKRTEGQKLNALQVEKTTNATEKDVRATFSREDLNRLNEINGRITELEQTRPALLPVAEGTTEEGRAPLDSYFLHRGSPGQKGSRMKPGVLTIAAHGDAVFAEPPADARTSWRRRSFAEWLTAAENPLTARVMINRIWQHHFGEGIVRTPSNFGKTGDAPTHPELLDWLASEFVKQDWSMKSMHRMLMTSNAYQMASDDNEAGLKADPDNRLLWRMPRRRLEGEIIRDAVLAAAGTLDLRIGGPGVHPYIDPSLWQGSSGRLWPGRPDSDPETWRRSVYTFQKRTIPLPMFEVFDRPDAIGSCARRNLSTTAPQALILMNNASIMMQAKFFAQRVQREAGSDPGRQIDRAFELALARPPSPIERAAAMKFIAANPEGLVDFCQTLFNTNEFVYIP